MTLMEQVNGLRNGKGNNSFSILIGNSMVHRMSPIKMLQLNKIPI